MASLQSEGQWRVWVYSFRHPNVTPRSSPTTNRKSTLPAIERQGARHRPLTAELVDEAELYEDGTWRRVASGWGELR